MSEPRPCPGPLAPRAPRVSLPPGACDTHVHVLGPYDRFAMQPHREYTAPEAPVAKLRAMLDTLGLARCVIVHVVAHGEDVSVTLDACRALGDRARGIAILKPDTTDAELDRMHAGGIRGIRPTPLFGEEPTIDTLRALATRIARLGWHMLYMPSSPEAWAEIGPRLPDLPVEIVLDHFAWRGWDVAKGQDQPGFRLLLDLARSGRCWVKLAGPSRFGKSPAPAHTDAAPYARALIEVRPDRMIWGTDWPHVRVWDYPMPDDAALVDLLAEWAPDAATRRTILTDNPAKLYGF
jgi:2-pyrone-4,6-dicarboxylate lactonase